MEVNNNEKNIKFGWKMWFINNNRCSRNNNNLYCCQIKQHQKINQTKSEFGHDNNVQNGCSFWIFDLLKCFSIIIVLNINFK